MIEETILHACPSPLRNNIDGFIAFRKIECQIKRCSRIMNGLPNLMLDESEVGDRRFRESDDDRISVIDPDEITRTNGFNNLIDCNSEGGIGVGRPESSTNSIDVWNCNARNRERPTVLPRHPEFLRCKELKFAERIGASPVSDLRARFKVR